MYSNPKQPDGPAFEHAALVEAAAQLEALGLTLTWLSDGGPVGKLAETILGWAYALQGMVGVDTDDETTEAEAVALKAYAYELTAGLCATLLLPGTAEFFSADARLVREHGTTMPPDPDVDEPFEAELLLARLAKT